MRDADANAGAIDSEMTMMVDDTTRRVNRAEKLCRSRRTYTRLAHAAGEANRLTHRWGRVYVPISCGVCGYYHVCRESVFEQTWDGPDH